MRILLTGAGGQVGSEFLRCGVGLGEIIATTRADCDLAEAASVRRAVRGARPDVIVNAAAFTAVDRAESDVEACFAANAVAPGVLAEEAVAIGALLLHYSTDYVFDGLKKVAYTEDDLPNPVSEYGRSKLEGERRILAAGARAIILRTSWVYGARGKNFLLTVLRLAQERSELRIVADQFGSPTSAREIAAATVRIIDKEKQAASWSSESKGGVYHMTAQGVTSWFGFAQAIVEDEQLSSRPRIVPITTTEYPTPARRPVNSAMSNKKFAATFGFQLRPWKDALKDVMLELAQGEGWRLQAGQGHARKQISEGHSN